MFIKNYSDSDLVINYRGYTKTLVANDVTCVDESWISLAMVKAMFGNYVEQVNPQTPIEDYLFDNQTEIELNKVYFVRALGPGSPRIYIDDGTVNIYFADGKDLPASKSDMSLFDDYTGVDGLIAMDVMPKWMLVEQASGTSTVVLTNIEATKQ